MGAGREWNVDGPSGGGIEIVVRALVEALDVDVVVWASK
jgi:hypothetical protein